MMQRLIIIMILSIILSGCGKVGPLALTEDIIDKSIITYPCEKKCMDELEAEKKRQQSIIIQTD